MLEQECVVGEIIDFHSTANILWEIPNYFSLPQKADVCFESPIFYFLESTWILFIHPNGSRSKKTVGYVSLFLQRDHSAHGSQIIDLTLSILCGNNLLGEVSCCHNFYSDMPVEWPYYVKRNELQRIKHQVAPDGILRVRCVAKRFHSITDATSQTVLVDGASTLCQDFRGLLDSEWKADVTIKIENQIFRAHKLILGTRSSVFAAMFEHDMKEKISGVVHIKNCDPNTFKDFLSFVYAGKTENLSLDNVVGLYSLANQYALKDLEELCVNFMKDNLCPDMVCDVLAISDKCDKRELGESARKLFFRNIKTIMSTEKWLHFVKENPLLATELLMAVIPEG